MSTEQLSAHSAVMQNIIEKAYNSGLHHAWRILQNEKHIQERKAVVVARKNRIDEEGEALYAAAILDRVAEVLLQQKKRGENGKSSGK